MATIGAHTNVLTSDACRVWAWPHIINLQALGLESPPAVRLIVGLYAQVSPTVKEVFAIYDLNLVLTPEVQTGLYGDVTLEEVFAFHMGIREEFFSNHEDARMGRPGIRTARASDGLSEAESKN